MKKSLLIFLCLSSLSFASGNTSVSSTGMFSTDLRNYAKAIVQNGSQINENIKEIENNKQGMALISAMDAIDFKNINEGELAFGVGSGNYKNKEAIGFGAAYSPTENFNINIKYSLTTGSNNDYAAEIGAIYKFKIK